MKTKLILFIFTLGMLLVIVNSFAIVSAVDATTATVQEKTGFFDKVFSSFTGNVVSEGNGVERNGNFISGYKYKDYVESEEKVIIDDGRGKVFAQVKLMSPKYLSVTYGPDVMVAEFLFENFDLTSSQNVMNNVEFYDLRNNLTDMNKTFKLKYLTADNKTASWTEFSKFNELPSKNIRVGLFTDTSMGQKVEWIPEMFNFKIDEWAIYTVNNYTEFQLSSKDVYLTISAINIDGAHILISYMDTSYHHYAVVVEGYINGTITNGTHLDIGVGGGGGSSGWSGLGQIDSTHYLSIIASRMNVLTVNVATNTVTIGPNQTHAGSSLGYAISVANLDANHILYGYGSGNNNYIGMADALTDGTINILNNYSIGGGVGGVAYAQGEVLKQIDSTHFLLLMANTTGIQAYVVTAATDGTISTSYKGNIYSGVTASPNYLSLAKKNTTHYMLVFEEMEGNFYNKAMPVVVDAGTYAVTTGATRILDTMSLDGYGQGFNSVEYVGGNVFVNSLAAPGNPRTEILLLNSTGGVDLNETKTYGVSYRTGPYGTSELFARNYSLHVYEDFDAAGVFATIFRIGDDAATPCSCPFINQNWVIDLTQSCVISSDCDIGIGTLSFSGTGYVNVSARIDTAKVIYPGAGGIVYMKSTGRIYVG